MKIKTKSSASKRVKVTKNGKGKFMLGNVATRHLLLKKSRKAKNKNAYGLEASKSDVNSIRRALVK